MDNRSEFNGMFLSFQTVKDFENICNIFRCPFDFNLYMSMLSLLMCDNYIDTSISAQLVATNTRIIQK